MRARLRWKRSCGASGLYDFCSSSRFATINLPRLHARLEHPRNENLDARVLLLLGRAALVVARIEPHRFLREQHRRMLVVAVEHPRLDLVAHDPELNLVRDLARDPLLLGERLVGAPPARDLPVGDLELLRRLRRQEAILDELAVVRDVAARQGHANLLSAKASRSSARSSR